MIPNGYIEALARYAADSEQGCEFISDALQEVTDQIAQGNSGAVTSTSVNGHAFGFADQMTLEEKLTALQQAHEQCLCAVNDVPMPGNKTHGVRFRIQH